MEEQQKELIHYGIPGMKWGVRKAIDGLGSNPIFKSMLSKRVSSNISRRALNLNSGFLKNVGKTSINPGYLKDMKHFLARRNFDRNLVGILSDYDQILKQLRR